VCGPEARWGGAAQPVDATDHGQISARSSLSGRLTADRMEESMSYYLSRVLELPFDEAVQRVMTTLKEQGFGVLTDIDVQATLKAKLGASVPPYRILGACNPSFAYQALQIEDKLGVLLPCNVIVRDAGGGKTEVAAIDPVSSMDRTGNPQLVAVAEEVRSRLQRAVESV
jgi:uncharacterized protein (DUF302 family)